MQTVPVTSDHPVVVKEKSIVEFSVRPLGLGGFTRLADETNAQGIEDRKKWQMHNKRLRMKHQIRALAEDGTELAIDDLDITQLPRALSVKLSNLLSMGDGEPGEVISGDKADGISSPILYRLGTPIKMQQNNDEVSINELEFMAATYGQIEEVLAETNEMSQAYSLIRTVAKPVGMGDTLQALPTWAADKITMADGFTIAEKVLPRFLE